jgi:hypothetical protein
MSMPNTELVTLDRQRRTGAAAERFDLGEDQAIDFGHDPGADGEIGAAQAKDDERGRKGKQERDDAAKNDRQQRIDPAIDREGKQHIAAEADECLLADGDETGIAGQQIPELRKRQHVEDEDQILNEPARREEWQQDEHDQKRNAGERYIARHRRCRFDPVGGLFHCALNPPRAGTGRAAGISG